MLGELGQSGLQTLKDQALNERDYGDLAGLNKDDARKKWARSKVHVWRRSYAVAPPGGESLRDIRGTCLALLPARDPAACDAREQVLISAHGNSLRALIMALEGLTGDEIVKRELDTGLPILYRLNADTTVAAKEVLSA